MSSTLLPSGLHDLLPPKAEQEALATRRLLEHFMACGYAQVTPTLVEYEETLITDESTNAVSFRVLDPLSQKMMAIRADMTMQIARIAGSLMQNQTRPLRLCYSGQTLRSQAHELRSSRQFRQIGIELFGVKSAETETEVMQTVITALQALELGNLSIDLNMSYIFDELTGDMEDAKRAELAEAVKRKDMQAIAAFDLPIIELLVRSSGTADDVLKSLASESLPPIVQDAIAHIKAVIETLNARLNTPVSITIDPLELQGFNYYSGLSFSVFLKDAGRQVGRGGSYHTADEEPATGFTFYTEDLLEHLPQLPARKRILVAPETTVGDLETLHEQGFTTAYSLHGDMEEEARALGCTHLYKDAEIKELS